MGVIIKMCIINSCLIKYDDGKIVKKRHYDLEQVCLNGNTSFREQEVSIIMIKPLMNKNHNISYS